MVFSTARIVFLLFSAIIVPSLQAGLADYPYFPSGLPSPVVELQECAYAESSVYVLTDPYSWESLNLPDSDGHYQELTMRSSSVEASCSEGTDLTATTFFNDLSGAATYCLGTFANLTLRSCVSPNDGGAVIANNGTWTGLAGTGAIVLSDGRVNVANMALGVYNLTYTRLTRSGTLTLTIAEGSEAGEQMSVPAFCTDAGVQNLIDQLTGADAGGTWVAGTGNPTGGTFNGTAGTFNPAGAATGFYTFLTPSPTPTGFLGTCTDNAKVDLFIGGPRVVAGPLSASCTNDAPNNDASIQISRAVGGDRYLLSQPNSPIVGNYTSATSFGAATFPLVHLQTTSLIPLGPVNYNIRVFGGSDACFTDVVVTLQAQDCVVGCDCTEFLYLNDEDLRIVHKFGIDASTGVVTEVGSPWFNTRAIANTLSPHGVAFDLNGFLYIAQRSGDDNPVMKLTCGGDLVDAEAIPDLPQQLFNMGSRNNTLYTGNTCNDEITTYDLCTGARTGGMLVRGRDVNGNILDVDIWSYYQDDTNWYVADRTTNAVYTGSLDESLYTSPASNQGTLLFNLVTPTANNIGPMGLTRDPAGNTYVVVNQTFSGAATPVIIQKFNSAGTSVASVQDNNNGGANTVNGLPGFWGARGIVYSEFTDRIYVSARENCVSVFSNDLTPLPAFNIANPANGRPKGVNLLKECCPTNNNVVVDTTLCAASVGDIVFLQELLDCNGAICEGLWEEGIGNTGLTYESCNNSIIINALDACGTFTFESDGTGKFNRCGVFKFTVNIEVENVTAPEIAAGAAPVCANNNDPGAFTFSTAASGSSAITYQWQQSTTDCDGPWNDVAGAPTDDTPFDPPALTEDTYYRVITSVNGACLTGMCADTSNCVMLTVENGCPICALTITPTVSGCYQNSGSKTTVSVEVAWSNATVSPAVNNTSDVITITLGGLTRTINPGPYTSTGGNGTIVSPQVVAFEIDADGSTGSIDAVFANDPACIGTSSYTAPTACPPTVCEVSTGQTGGTVFNDYNANGIKENGESTGVAGVPVTAYDCNGNSFTTTTDEFGLYSFTG